MMALRRGIVLHHDAQRQGGPAPWSIIEPPVDPPAGRPDLWRSGLGWVGIAAAMRAKTALRASASIGDPPHRRQGRIHGARLARCRLAAKASIRENEDHSSPLTVPHPH